jgi:trypsin
MMPVQVPLVFAQAISCRGWQRALHQRTVQAHAHAHALALVLVLFLLVTSTPTAAMEARVVGGNTVTDPLLFPYFAQLADAQCGAVLVHDDYLLTAAHCERQSHPFYKRVYFASTKIRQGILRIVQHTNSHPAYLPSLQDYDFSLLKLSASALVDEHGRPTGVQILPINRNATVPFPGDPLQTMGFGKLTEDQKDLSSTLQEARVEYIEDATCEKDYGPDHFFNQVMFCGGLLTGGKDTCQGDSGGPVVDVTRGVLAGIVSYGIGCGREGFPGVNSRVSAVADWIDAEICRGSAFPPPACPRKSQTVSVRVVNETMGAMTLHATLDSYPDEFVS